VSHAHVRKLPIPAMGPSIRMAPAADMIVCRVMDVREWPPESPREVRQAHAGAS
jgi:hypothetical protein